MALRNLLTSVSANTTTAAIQLKQPGHAAVHLVTLIGAGTFAGAKIKPQIGVSNSTDGSFWVGVDNGIITASSAVNIEVADGFWFRVIVSAASAGNTALMAWMSDGKSAR